MAVYTEAHKKEVEKICKKNNWKCPVVYTFREIKEKRGLKLNNLIIDNLDEFLDWCMREIGLCVRVDTVGLNVDGKEYNSPIYDTGEESTPIYDICERNTNIKDICEDLAQ